MVPRPIRTQLLQDASYVSGCPDTARVGFAARGKAYFLSTLFALICLSDFTANVIEIAWDCHFFLVVPKGLR